ncbi:hypothetical protein E4U15_004643 [Claviceps sp. LM218 group G6]|nr:hypothetical protein E4U15_004643 [Claviceps sp. LM218 group G6]
MSLDQFSPSGFGRNNKLVVINGKPVSVIEHFAAAQRAVSGVQAKLQRSWVRDTCAISDKAGRSMTLHEDEDGIDDEASDLQAGHGTHVGGMIYTRELQKGLGGIALAWKQFRELSTKWRQAVQIAAHKTKHG